MTPALNRLRWLCRRGMLELDILLDEFLRLHHSELDPRERQAFERLLALDDAVLWQHIQQNGGITTALHKAIFSEDPAHDHSHQSDPDI